MKSGSQLILHSQTFKFTEIFDAFPPDGKLKKKIFFQAELVAIEEGTASFHIIAYPAWRIKGEWVVGSKVCASESGNGSVIPFKEPMGFGNNEVPVAGYKLKKKKHGKRACKKYNEFAKFFRKVSLDPKLASQAIFRCNTGISKNPHLEYTVTLEAGGTAVSTSTNPSPPARPEY
jgi:hypothetical protein